MDTQCKPVTHVIFDVDGLLLDTERLYTIATQQIANEFGKTYTKDLKRSVMGTTNDDAANALVKGMDLPITAQEFQQRMEKQYHEVFPDAKLLPGVEKLIRHLHRCNIPIAIATSASQFSYDLKTQKHHQELFSLFDHVVCGSTDPDVKNGKPAPDIFLVCLSRFCDAPASDKVLVFEDAVNGVKAARAAGMQVVMVPDHDMGFDPEHMKIATEVLDSLADFKPEKFGLPPFNASYE